MKITAVVYEDIPANRLIGLKGAGNDPELDDSKIYLKLAGKDWIPDMVSTRDLKAGEEITVEIKGSPVWRAELSKKTRPGTLVSCDGEGKIGWTNTQDHKFYCGFSLEGGEEGDVISFYRFKNGVVGQALETMRDILNNGDMS